MAHAAAMSIDRQPRRPRGGAPAEAVDADPTGPLRGLALGVIARRFGLMTSETTIRLEAVVGSSGDLAVADRMAFIAALERREVVLVVEADGWYVACTILGTTDAVELAGMHALPDEEPALRLMSVVTERGITPALGPLARG